MDHEDGPAGDDAPEANLVSGVGAGQLPGTRLFSCFIFYKKNVSYEYIYTLRKYIDSGCGYVFFL